MVAHSIDEPNTVEASTNNIKGESAGVNSPAQRYYLVARHRLEGARQLVALRLFCLEGLAHICLTKCELSSAIKVGIC